MILWMTMVILTTTISILKFQVELRPLVGTSVHQLECVSDFSAWIPFWRKVYCALLINRMMKTMMMIMVMKIKMIKKNLFIYLLLYYDEQYSPMAITMLCTWHKTRTSHYEVFRCASISSTHPNYFSISGLGNIS